MFFSTLSLLSIFTGLIKTPGKVNITWEEQYRLPSEVERLVKQYFIIVRNQLQRPSFLFHHHHKKKSLTFSFCWLPFFKTQRGIIDGSCVKLAQCINILVKKHKINAKIILAIFTIEFIDWCFYYFVFRIFGEYHLNLS